MLRVTLRGSSVPAVTLGSGETLLFGRSPGLPAADPHVQLRRHVLALPNCARHISRLLGELAVADDVVRLRWRRTTEAQLYSLFDAPGGARRVTLVKGMSALLDEGENHIVVLRGWSTGPDEYADIVLSVDVAQVVPADEPVIVGDLSDPDGAATGPAPTLEPRSREWYVALALAERLGRPGAGRGARRLGAGTGQAAGRRSPATPAGTAGRRYSRGARGLGRVRRVGAVGRGTGRRAARCRAPPADRAPPGAGNARPPAARRLLRDAGRAGTSHRRVRATAAGRPAAPYARRAEPAAAHRRLAAERRRRAVARHRRRHAAAAGHARRVHRRQLVSDSHLPAAGRRGVDGPATRTEPGPPRRHGDRCGARRTMAPVARRPAGDLSVQCGRRAGVRFARATRWAATGPGVPHQRRARRPARRRRGERGGAGGRDGPAIPAYAETAPPVRRVRAPGLLRCEHAVRAGGRHRGRGPRRPPPRPGRADRLVVRPAGDLPVPGGGRRAGRPVGHRRAVRHGVRGARPRGGPAHPGRGRLPAR